MQTIPSIYVEGLWTMRKNLFSRSYRASWYCQSFIY